MLAQDADGFDAGCRKEGLHVLGRQKLAEQPALEEDEAPVPDLMSALKASLDAVKSRDGGEAKKKPAAAAKKPAAKKAKPKAKAS